MLFLLLAFFSQGASTQTQFEQAVAALAAGDLAKAEAGFQAVLKAQPSSLAALGNLGVVYSRMDRPSDAIDIYTRALKLSPDEPRLLLNLGLAHLKLDEYISAKPLFAKALAKSPDSAQLRELVGTTQAYTGEAQEALATVASLPKTPGVLYLRMLAYLKLDRKQEAQETSAELFAKLGSAEAHFVTGRAYYESTLLEQAAAALEQAVKADPKLPGAQRELGKTYVSLRKIAEARDRLQAALQHNPYDQEAAYFLGAILVQEGSLKDGIRYLEQSAKTRPNFWGVHYYLGRAFLQQGDTTAALRSLDRAAALNPDEPSVHYQLARAFKAAGREKESRAASDQVRALRSKAVQSEQEALVLK
jgi:tetratricopeptide (TPR) repeat protein